jgi:hypothetical protein
MEGLERVRIGGVVSLTRHGGVDEGFDDPPRRVWREPLVHGWGRLRGRDDGAGNPTVAD